jgi:DNA-binding winged helix-turn-helix (wHTH) protein/pimeloyl-ACP methyl ester carboxylesterase
LRYAFGAYVIDTDRVELRRELELVNVEPQVFDVLVYLIRNQDRVVSADELFDRLWEGRVVSLSTLTTRINAARKAIGDSGAEQKLIKTLQRRGYRFVGAVQEIGADRAVLGHAAIPDGEGLHQEIQFCTSGNDVRIAYARAGKGPPMVRVGNWFHHLEHDWDSPVWGHMLKWLASEHELIRYDMRGIGLSDHDVQEISLDAFVRDVESVTNAAGLDQFVLFGASDGAAVSIAYAVRHPKRVSKLVLFGGYAQGGKLRGSDVESAKVDATIMMMRPGWGPDNPLMQRMFSSQFIPEGTPDQIRWLHDLQAKSDSSANTVRKLAMTSQLDIVHLLPQIAVPTLVMHCRGDSLHAFEQGRMLAARIPGAKFVALEGNNHILLEQDLDWPKFQREFTVFLAA